MQKTELVQRFLESLSDPVDFAGSFLNFEAFPYQKEFLRDDSPMIVACCARQVGKTTLTSIKALHYALSRPSVRILIVSAGLRQSIILFDKILTFIGEALPVRVLVIYRSRTRVRFANGSEIVALPCGRDGSTLRGYTADMVILDEANFIPRIVIDSVIRPTTITRPNARMIMISTPWTKDHPFYEALTRPELGFRAYTWPASMSPLIPKERLQLEKETLGEHDFNREYNALFVDEQFCYFPSRLLLECVDGEQELLKDESVFQEGLKGVFHLGVDFGKRVDYTVLAVVEEVEDRAPHLVYLKQFPLGTAYATVTGWIRRLNEAFRFSSATLDQTGVGEAPVEDVKVFLRAAEGVILSNKMKLDVLSNLLRLIEHKRLIIPLDQTLIAQINGQQYQMTKTGQVRFTHPARSHDDQLWALALATWGAQESHARPSFKPITRSF